MSENLTERSSAAEPAREYPVRGSVDEQVHLAQAAPVDVVDPAELRTYCGQAVMEVYNDGRDASCDDCAGDAERRDDSAS